MTKKLLHLFVLLILSNITFAQSVDRSVICSAGQTDKNSTYTVEWTLGDLGVGGTSVTQGFNQAFEKTFTPVVEVFEKSFVKCFPNPVQTILNITVSEDYQNSKIVLVDVVGKTVKQIELTEVSSTSVNVSEIPNGVYFVSFIKNNLKCSVKIVKN